MNPERVPFAAARVENYPHTPTPPREDGGRSAEEIGGELVFMKTPNDVRNEAMLNASHTLQIALERARVHLDLAREAAASPQTHSGVLFAARVLARLQECGKEITAAIEVAAKRCERSQLDAYQTYACAAQRDDWPIIAYSPQSVPRVARVELREPAYLVAERPVWVMG